MTRAMIPLLVSANGVKLLALYAGAKHEHRLHPSKSLLGFYIYGHIKGDIERCWDNITAPNWEKPEDPWKNDAILIQGYCKQLKSYNHR